MSLSESSELELLQLGRLYLFLCKLVLYLTQQFCKLNGYICNVLYLILYMTLSGIYDFLWI